MSRKGQGGSARPRVVAGARRTQQRSARAAGPAAGLAALVPGASSAALLTLLAAGLARLAYEDAYRQVGTTLDAVGLSNARLLTLAGATSLALIGLALLTALPAGLLRDRLRERGPAGRADTAAAALFAALLALLGAGLRFLPFPTVTLGIGVALAVPLLGPLLLRVEAVFSNGPGRSHVPGQAPGPASPRAPAQATLPRTYLRASVISFALLALLAVLTLRQAAPAGRALAEQGPAASSRTLRLLDLAPMPVCVRALNGQGLPGLPAAQLLLGTNAGVHVLLAPNPGARAQVVPAAAVRLEGQPPAGPDALPDCT